MIITPRLSTFEMNISQQKTCKKVRFSDDVIIYFVGNSQRHKYARNGFCWISNGIIERRENKDAFRVLPFAKS